MSSPPLLPPRLRRGDVIGLIAPAGPVRDGARIGRAVRYFERLGYHVAVGEHAARARGYLAGRDDQRLADFHAMFRAPEVRAVIALRGGYGSSRLLSAIDYRLIARNPKILVGYSDLTALQMAVWKKCRLVTFHGPMAGVEFAGRMDPFTEEHFWQMVTSPAVPLRLVAGRSAGTSRHSSPPVTGRLLGGNLSLLVSLLGTPFQPDLRGAILMVEEIGEEPYRIDRMLTHLRNAGALRHVRGILAGRFIRCVPSTRPSPGTAQVLRDAAGTLPFLQGFPFGHLPRKLTLPLGVPAALDPARRSLDLLGPAVS